MRRTPSTLAALLATALAAPLPAQGPMSLPIQVTATVDTSLLATTGRATLQLTFTTEAPLDEPFAVRVELHAQNRLLQRRDHAPPEATTRWAAGKSVRYELPLFFPLTPKTSGDVAIRLGFLAAGDDKPRPPLTRDRARDGLATVATFAFPPVTADFDDQAVDAAIVAATALATKSPAAAFDQLEFVFRRVESYPQKARLQKALLQVGKMPPSPLSLEERAIVAGRIHAERTRYLREVAGRLYDRGRLFAALVLLDEVGGSLQEQADRAVLGALADATRTLKDRDAIAEKVFTLNAEQEAELQALAQKHPDEAERLEVGIELGKNPKKRAVARELIRRVEFVQSLRSKAEDARRAIERAWLADVPADERAEADAAMQHPSWARTAQRVSHRFVLIGPRTLIEGIPDDSLLRFDLAYLYLTDLFGRVPNPEGDRVTVYWKELWDFGGGIGGGKIIDIGNAQHDQKDLRVDGGLYYHELTHCIDDTKPIYAGFREGLADFGAAFALHELGQVAAARGAFGIAQRAFLGDYLERDLEYWRIPNYGPSAGFLLHFVQAHGKDGNGYRWDKYRRFFRDYRDCPVDDTRVPGIARAFAFHLVEAFGEAAFDDLRRFRWPLLPTDLDAVRKEQIAARQKSQAAALDELPGSPVPRDREALELQQRAKGRDDHALRLGVVTDWWIIGPFRKEGIEADAFRFPPELEVDFAAVYDSINNRPTWQRASDKNTTLHASGWVQFEWAYMNDSALYALTHVVAEREEEAWLHVRADDDVTLFWNDAEVGKLEHHAGSLGPWRPDGRVLLPDAGAFRVTLRPGRNKLLVKVYNRAGAAGFALAIARRNGLPLPGWRPDLGPPDKKSNQLEPLDGRRWPSRFRLRGDQSASVRKLDVTVGDWRSRNKFLEGFATDRQVEWRKYTVRPGFPKDSPSNLAWLPEKATADAELFQLTIDLAPGSPPPKLCVIVQGEGQRDALSGWTLVLEPIGERVRARLERYDQLVFMSDQAPWQPDADRPTTLELLHTGNRLTVRLGSVVLFDQAPLRPIPGRHRIGLATWGDSVRIAELELRAPTRTR
jgi:hypothetical protein